MNWIRKGSRHLSPPYQILFSVHGYEVWLRDEKKYTVIARRVPYLDAAKQKCLEHSLRAEMVKA